MKITYKVGNLLEADERVILQQVNARGAMGSGVAKAIMMRYPLVYTTYRAVHAAHGLVMGSVHWIDCRENDNGHLVGNIVGQPDFGASGAVYTDYLSLRKGIAEANGYLKNAGITAAAFPLIGAGLGGGDWSKISAIIEEEMIDVQPVVYVLNENLIP